MRWGPFRARRGAAAGIIATVVSIVIAQSDLTTSSDNHDKVPLGGFDSDQHDNENDVNSSICPLGNPRERQHG